MGLFGKIQDSRCAAVREPDLSHPERGRLDFHGLTAPWTNGFVYFHSRALRILPAVYHLNQQCEAQRRTWRTWVRAAVDWPEPSTTGVWIADMGTSSIWAAGFEVAWCGNWPNPGPGKTTYKSVYFQSPDAAWETKNSTIPGPLLGLLIK